MWPTHASQSALDPATGTCTLLIRHVVMLEKGYEYL